MILNVLAVGDVVGDSGVVQTYQPVPFLWL